MVCLPNGVNKKIKLKRISRPKRTIKSATAAKSKPVATKSFPGVGTPVVSSNITEEAKITPVQAVGKNNLLTGTESSQTNISSQLNIPVQQKIEGQETKKDLTGKEIKSATIVIPGLFGDLGKKKIVPALYELIKKGMRGISRCWQKRERS